MTPTDLAMLHALCFTTPRPWRASEFADLLDNPHTILCTRPHGFLLGRTAGPEAEVLTLAVHPGARRKGIARALLGEFEQIVCSRNATEVFLEVACDNRGAIALYRAAGYHRTGTRHAYYQAPDGATHNADVMVRRLKAPDAGR